ncbi:hypothetical protein [Massilia niastensis]|uniref:hypothetical protein n=1 Tax=Massilia niastensis TaxID=544911 RepID=UPI001B7FA00D|nr:hypothetical protein [Massilia niastensis]
MRQSVRTALAAVLAAGAFAPATTFAQPGAPGVAAPAVPAAPAAPALPAMPSAPALPALAASPTRPPASAVPAARPADVASIDAIVGALYQVISGAAGAPRDWDRMRSLFTPEGRMMALGARPDGGIVMRPMSVDDYIARNSRNFATMGFFETELARTTDSFGQIAHVFSTYEARHAPGDATPFMRGINTIQLVHDGKRWYVLSLAWRAEDAALPLPERYLQSR